MYSHALYTGTIPWSTSTGNLLSAYTRASPALSAGEADPPRAGTLPFVSAAGSLARENVDYTGIAVSGRGQAFPCGPYHAGEEVP